MVSLIDFLVDSLGLHQTLMLLPKSLFVCGEGKNAPFMFKTQQMKNTVKRARCGPKESFNCVNHFAACCLMFHQGNKNEND